MGASPVGVPTGSPGTNANALARVREALKLLIAELPNLNPGSDEYKGVYDAIGKISKVVPPSAEVPGIQQQALRGLQSQAQQSGMMQAVMRSGGGQPPAPPQQQPAAA